MKIQPPGQITHALVPNSNSLEKYYMGIQVANYTPSGEQRIKEVRDESDLLNHI